MVPEVPVVPVGPDVLVVPVGKFGDLFGDLDEQVSLVPVVLVPTDVRRGRRQRAD